MKMSLLVKKWAKRVDENDKKCQDNCRDDDDDDEWDHGKDIFS